MNRYQESQRRFHVQANTQALDMLRKYNRLSIRELSRISGVSRGLVGDLMTGRRKSCTPETATRIEKALRADPHTVFLIKPLPVAETRNAA